MKKTRYAICGLSVRAIYQFALPLLGKNIEGGKNFDDRAELVAILDLDRERVAGFCNKVGAKVPFYPASAFGRMLRETRPDVILALGPDGTHCQHIVGGLLAGCDVIAEKPMVIDCRQLRRVREAEQASGRKVRVAHNYRYTPTHRRLKRMILEGKLGRIVNVEFTYNLDTFHGPSYFYRWNRDRKLSGGLSISKSCHHFDLVNWWLADVPETLFAFGGLNYLGTDGALRPRGENGDPLPPEEEKRRCPVFQKHYAGKFAPESNQISTGWDAYRLPYDAQYPPGERRYIYDAAIRIEDHYGVVARYRNGAILNYSINFCTPWEGYILGVNGTAGRAEIVCRTDPDPTGKPNPAAEVGHIIYYPLWGGKEVIEIPPEAGGHGGADFASQEDLLGEPSDEAKELQLVADSTAGGYAIAMGEATWRSVISGKPMDIGKMLAPVRRSRPLALPALKE